MQSLNKKAVANVIAVVFLILLSLSAVILVGAVVNKLIGSVRLSPKFSCLEMQISPPIEIEKACYNSKLNKLEVTIKRDISTEIEFVDFILAAPSGSSEEWTTLNCESGTLLNKGETRIYELSPTDFQENSEIKISISDCLLDSKRIDSSC